MITFNSSKPKIAIFRALQLGDLLCSIPAVRCLRQVYPDAEIVWIGLPWTTYFVSRFEHYIDRCIIFPGYPGLPEQPFNEVAWQLFVAQVQSESFDLIIQMQGNGSIVNELLPEWGARAIAGYHSDGCRIDSPLFMDYPDNGHEITRHIRLMQQLGIPCYDDALEFPIHPGEERALQELLHLDPVQKYVCVHPGSRGSWRQWPPAAFAALADVCAQTGFKVFVTGTADEVPIVQAVLDHMQEPATSTAGKTDLGMVASLIRGASLLIANCTGVSHIAAALQTPSLIISMDGEPERWGPRDRSLHTTIDWTTQPYFGPVRDQLVQLLGEQSPHKIY